MDGSKLFLGGHTLMQPHSYILLPFTIYPPQEDGCTVGKQNHGSVNGIFQYTTLGGLTLFSIGQRVGPGRVQQLSTIRVDG